VTSLITIGNLTDDQEIKMFTYKEMKTVDP